MMKFVAMFEVLKDDIDLYLIVLLSIIITANLIDFSFGWLNAKFNKSVKFESGIALYGIIKKMMYFIVLVFFTIIALAIIPHEVSIPAITALYIGYLWSEVNSILSHLGITEDGKKGEVFSNFISKLFKGENK